MKCVRKHTLILLLAMATSGNGNGNEFTKKPKVQFYCNALFPSADIVARTASVRFHRILLKSVTESEIVGFCRKHSRNKSVKTVAADQALDDIRFFVSFRLLQPIAMLQIKFAFDFRCTSTLCVCVHSIIRISLPARDLISENN